MAALGALGHKLDERGTVPVSLLMCGGAALNISGLLTRLTADVDVLGDMHANGELGEMPDWIYPLAAEVAEELGLERHWLNDDAASVHAMENLATLCINDSDFARFPGLNWRNLLHTE